MHQKSEPYESINYFFIANKYTGKIKNNDSNNCEEIKLVDFKYPINNIEPYINVAIKNYEKKPDNHFTLYGWNKEGN